MNTSEKGETQSAIQQFYAGRRVLVTGATGTLGKVLVEKLLRSTAVATIYMLVRPKKGNSVEQRVAEYFDDPLFSRLKEEVKDCRERVEAVSGDISHPGLGLSAEDAHLLQAEAEVIFHGAATVKFDESLDQAVATNVKGTKCVLFLAKKCVKLKAFVYISTAYANCTQTEIHEEFFEPPLTGDGAIQLTESLTKQQAGAISVKICGKYPNTYAFSKAMAENIVKVYGQGLPIGVYRPSIVLATAKEPMKGWIDNVYGPTGVQVSVGAGVLRTLWINEELVADLVPVDMVVSALAATAWDVTHHRIGGEIPVYNYVSSCQNPIRWGLFTNTSLAVGRQIPSPRGIWYYMLASTKYRLLFLLYEFLLHMIPAVFLDTLLLTFGKKPRLLSIYKKIHNFSKVISYFTTREWRFHDARMMRVWSKMTDRDREHFNFDITDIDWSQYVQDTLCSMRRSFFKDTPNTIPAGKRKQQWLFVVHYLLVTVLMAPVLWFIYQFTLSILPANNMLYFIK